MLSMLKMTRMIRRSRPGKGKIIMYQSLVSLLKYKTYRRLKFHLKNSHKIKIHQKTKNKIDHLVGNLHHLPVLLNQKFQKVY